MLRVTYPYMASIDKLISKSTSRFWSVCVLGSVHYEYSNLQVCIDVLKSQASRVRNAYQNHTSYLNNSILNTLLRKDEKMEMLVQDNHKYAPKVSPGYSNSVALSGP